MKYYKFELNRKTPEYIDELTGRPRIYPEADTRCINNTQGHLGLHREWGYLDGVDPATVEVFDHFILWSITYEKVYDWILLDAYPTCGPYASFDRHFFISKRFKELLEGFKIAKPFSFFESKLLYQGEKLPYYILHLFQDECDVIDLVKSALYIDGQRHEECVTELSFRRKFIRENRHKFLYDLYYTVPAMDLFYFPKLGYIVSEDLKVAIEEAKLTDFRFEEITEAKFHFTDDIA